MLFEPKFRNFKPENHSLSSTKKKHKKAQFKWRDEYYKWNVNTEITEKT